MVFIIDLNKESGYFLLSVLKGMDYDVKLFTDAKEVNFEYDDRFPDEEDLCIVDSSKVASAKRILKKIPDNVRKISFGKPVDGYSNISRPFNQNNFIMAIRRNASIIGMIEKTKRKKKDTTNKKLRKKSKKPDEITLAVKECKSSKDLIKLAKKLDVSLKQSTLDRFDEGNGGLSVMPAINSIRAQLNKKARKRREA